MLVFERRLFYSPVLLGCIISLLWDTNIEEEKKGRRAILKINLVTLFIWLIVTTAIEKVPNGHVQFVHGVVDRLEDQDQAVILVESKNQEWVVAQERFPEITEAGMSVIVKLNNDVIIQLFVDVNRTIDREEKSLQLMRLLRQQKR